MTWTDLVLDHLDVDVVELVVGAHQDVSAVELFLPQLYQARGFHPRHVVVAADLGLGDLHTEVQIRRPAIRFGD